MAQYKQPSLQYTTHVQDYGWQASASDDQLSGTSGEGKRLEGIKIQLVNQKYSGGIEYRTHVQEEGCRDLSAMESWQVLPENVNVWRLYKFV